MTTYIPFSPSIRAAPIFYITLDGAAYQATARWNLSRQDYYLMCSDLNGVLQFSEPIVETYPGVQIESAVWDILSGRVTITTTDPHKYMIGTVQNLVIEGMAPDAYNGQVQADITGETTLTYPLAVDPGTPQQFGQASFYISFTKGYFASTFIYRNSQFEINP